MSNVNMKKMPNRRKKKAEEEMQLQKTFISEQVSAAHYVVTGSLMNEVCFDTDYVAFCTIVQSPSADDRVVRPQVSTGTTRGGALLDG